MNRLRAIGRGDWDGEKQSGGCVTSIVSGKGGVGKTNLALNVGIQIARRGPRVILLDADFGLANADILLGAAPRADFTALLDPQRNIDDLLLAGPHGLRVLCGVSGSTRLATLRAFGPRACRWALARLRHACDVLLVDCSAGVNPVIVTFALASDRVILTTTPEPTALADGYATLKLLSHAGVLARPSVVVNMARSRAEAERVAQRLDAVARRFLGLSLENLGHVTLDPHVPRAVRSRTPVVLQAPRCAASLCLEEISMRIRPALRRSAAGGTVWSRVAALFL